MPDDELLQLAKAGKIREQLSSQVHRMLEDKRSLSLIQNFVGQWLRTRDVETVSIDALAVFGLRKEFDEEVGDFRRRRDRRSTKQDPDPELERLRSRFKETYDGSNRVFPEIGIAEGHHHSTHNQDKEDLASKVAAIDRFYMDRFSRFLDRLSKMQDIDGKSVLYNSMIVYGGAIADGNRHTHDNLPVLLAGHAGGRITTGRYLQVEAQQMANLFVSMLGQYGMPAEAFGDSTSQKLSLA